MKLNPKWLKLDNAWVRNIIPQSRLKHYYPIERPRSTLTDAVLPQRRDWFTFTVDSTSLQEANTKFWHWNWKLTKVVVKRSNDQTTEDSLLLLWTKLGAFVKKKSLQTTQTLTRQQPYLLRLDFRCDNLPTRELDILVSLRYDSKHYGIIDLKCDIYSKGWLSWHS